MSGRHIPDTYTEIIARALNDDIPLSGNTRAWALTVGADTHHWGPSRPGAVLAVLERIWRDL
jgi:hypothetical protein